MLNREIFIISHCIGKKDEIHVFQANATPVGKEAGQGWQEAREAETAWVPERGPASLPSNFASAGTGQDGGNPGRLRRLHAS